MLKKEQKQLLAIEMLCTDMLVLKEYLPRKIDAAIDFGHIYDLMDDYIAKITDGQVVTWLCCLNRR